MVDRNGEAMTDLEEGFESGTEITFNCIIGAAGERTTWKIICEDGAWVGRSQICGEFQNEFPMENIRQAIFSLRISIAT